MEVDTQGDAFFVAFGRASRRAGRGAEGTEDLGQGPIRVRMGLHTGEALRDRRGLRREDVHRAALIAAAGHGGQSLFRKQRATLSAGIRCATLGSTD